MLSWSLAATIASAQQGGHLTLLAHIRAGLSCQSPELNQIPVVPSYPQPTCSLSRSFRAALQRQNVLNLSASPSLCKAATTECMNDTLCVFRAALLLKSALWRCVGVEPDKYYKRTFEVLHSTRKATGKPSQLVLFSFCFCRHFSAVTEIL